MVCPVSVWGRFAFLEKLERQWRVLGTREKFENVAGSFKEIGESYKTNLRVLRLMHAVANAMTLFSVDTI